MKPQTPIVRAATALVALILLLVAVSALGRSSPTPPDLSDVRTIDSPWLLESDFDSDPALYATEGQVVVLELEGRRHGQGVFRENTIRFLVEKERRFAFCIAAEDPHLVRLRLERDPDFGSAERKAKAEQRRQHGRTVLTHHRGGACKPVRLTAGGYTLRVFHDSRDLPYGGKLAFLAPPAPINMLGDSTSPATLDFIVFKGPNEEYVTQSEWFGVGYLTSTGTSVDASSVWQFVWQDGDGSGPFGLEDGSGKRVNAVQCVTYFYTGSISDGTGCPDVAAEFTIEGPADAFSLAVIGVDPESAEPSPVLVNDAVFSNELAHDGSDQSPAIMSADYRGFHCANEDCSGDALVLQKGEVALFSQCDFKGPAVVFTTDVPDFSIYDAAAALGLGVGDNMAASLRVGTDTLAVLYSDAQFGGTSLRTAADIACLDSTALGSAQTSSLQLIQGAVEYVVSSNGCVGCDLSGLDLSGYDFSGADFSAANLTDVSLLDANLSDATIAAATIAGANFQLTNLSCTSLSRTDLTSADFGSGNPLIATDLSCRLDLSSATLDVSTFPVALWRYMNLTNATIHNVSGATLSTKAAPLDLSNAILDGVNLSQAVLAGAVFKDASLQGTDLTYANLDGADLYSANLAALPNGTVAKLTGAFLRDANLAGANLTGVIANYASFYLSDEGTAKNATANGATMTGAKWNNAYLANADFGSASLESTEWTQAVLVGVNFDSADLQKNTTAGEITDFSNAYLQGAVFNNAKVGDADFTGSYWDASGNAALNIELQPGNVEFTGYWGSTPECVTANYPTSGFGTATLPPTTASNTCPDGNPGPCNDAASQTPRIPMSEATPPAALNQQLPGDCTITDFNWVFPTD